MGWCENYPWTASIWRGRTEKALNTVFGCVCRQEDYWRRGSGKDKRKWGKYWWRTVENLLLRQEVIKNMCKKYVRKCDATARKGDWLSAFRSDGHRWVREDGV